MLQATQVPAASGWRDLLAAAVDDMVDGLRSWRMWWLLAAGDIRQRYQRSLLGQFWLTISMGVTIGAIGVVYSVLFHQNMATYLPFLGVGLVCWGLLAGIVNDGCTVFIQSGEFLRQARLPRSLFVHRMLLRNLIVFAHNLVIVALILIIYAIPLRAVTLLAIPGLLLTMITGVWVALLLGTFCARFRDLPQIIVSVVQVAFFVTPVIYKPDAMNNQLWVVTHLNPFASFLALVRDPLLGTVPEASHYAIALLFTIGGFAVTFPFFARFRARIVYWL